MPENETPVTKTEAGAAAGEFNFEKPETENPRIKRRSLKAKPAGLIKPTVPAAALSAARELEREAPPLSAEEVAKNAAIQAQAAKATSAIKVASGAPPRTTPTTSTPVHSTPKTASSATTTMTPSSTTTAGPASSPHGTRPATLYYSSNSSTTRKAETPSPMKTIPTPAATASSSSSSSATAVPTSVARPTTASATRPSPAVDYRANVERQTREQKSVGSILSYIVYALIALFVISAALAGYGAHVIFKQLSDQSVTVSDLDARYAAANKDLSAKLSATQDTLTAAQAQIARQQDLIVKQQETLNQLLAASTANDAAIKQEKQARLQETQTRTQDEASLRAKIKDIEYRTSIQKY